MTTPARNLQTSQNADRGTRVTAASIQASRAQAKRPPGLTAEDIAKATPDEAIRIKNVIFAFDMLDRILANLATTNATDVFHFDESVRPPSNGATKGLFARILGKSESTSMDQREHLQSPAYQALWDELLARGFVPELRFGERGPNSCNLYARMPKR